VACSAINSAPISVPTAMAISDSEKVSPIETTTAPTTTLNMLTLLPNQNANEGCSLRTRRWVQEVPIVKKTAKLIYFTSDSWNGREAVVSPGCINREQFETDTRQRIRGYPAGVIPIPGDRHLPGQAGWLFFASREAAETYLYRREPERAEHSAPEAGLIKKLRRAMADAHPDRGGTTEQFIQARRQYQAVLQHA
jgi:hypothetical protein